MKISPLMGVEGGVAKFFGKWFRVAPAVGIDIGSYSIKVVVLRRNTAKGADVSASAGEFFLDPGLPDSVRSGLLFLRDDFGLKGEKAAVSISGGPVFTSRVKVSPSCAGSLKMTEDAVSFHLSKFFPEGMEGYRHDFYQYPDSPEDVLVTVAKKDAVEGCVSGLSASGIIPAVMDYDGFAVINAYNNSFERGSSSAVPDGLTVLLNVGHSVTNFSVLENSKTVLTRDLSSGLGRLTSEIAVAGDMTPDEAEAAKNSLCDGARAEFLSAAREFSLKTAGEVKSNLEMFADLENKRIAKVVLSGGGSLLHGFCEAVSETLGADVEYADPLKDVSMENDGEYLSELSPKTAVAFGLALRMSE